MKKHKRPRLDWSRHQLAKRRPRGGHSRQVDPVFMVENTGKFVFGKVFKDYKPTSW